MIRLPILSLHLVLCTDLLGWISLAQTITLHPPNKLTEIYENQSYAVVCESPNAVHITWYRINKKSRDAVSFQRNDHLFVEQEANKAQLTFPNVTAQQAGFYECAASNGDKSIVFELKVLEPLTFLPKKDVYYALPRDNITLEFHMRSSTKPTLVWKINDENIDGFPGNHFKMIKGGLSIFNVTGILYGNYSCIAYFITDLNSESRQINIALKQAKSPEIKEMYSNNTLHVLPNRTANIKCEVTAEPSARIQWFRNGAELDLRTSNATIENQDNKSILKIFYSRADFLGKYMCHAENDYGNSSITIALTEGQLPETPNLSLGKSTDRSCFFSIYPTSPNPNLLFVKAYHKKHDDNSSNWIVTNLSIDANNLYFVDQLEPRTKYNIKVETCSDHDICLSSKENYCETIAQTTGSANLLVQNIIIQFIILLPAFIIGFYSQW